MRLFPNLSTTLRALVCAGALVLGPLASGGLAQMRDPLFAVAVLDDHHAWAAGAFGSVLQSADSGTTWRPLASATDEPLFGISFAAANAGWAVGRTGIILHTTDGGSTWTAQANPRAPHHLFHVHALSPQAAVAIGDWGTVIVTEDAGRTWQDRSLDRDVILNDQSWNTIREGWLVGEAGAIFSTSDGGRTWTERDSGVFKTLFGVSFADARRGWAVGLDGLILSTADGGESWDVVRGSAGLEVFEEVEFDDAFRNPTLFDVAVSGRFGVAVGDLGAVFTSVDGGLSWERQDLEGDANLRWLRAVALTSSGNGFAVGARGSVLRIAAGRPVPAERPAAAAPEEP